MNKGFFIVLVKAQMPWKSGAAKRGNYFRADLLEPIAGWEKTNGDTMEGAAALQRAQYDSRLAEQKPVPALVPENDGPMANGQIVRFVAVS